jgi:hypothetical protein
MAATREGLSYFLTRRPELEGAPALAALPVDIDAANEVIRDEFIDFCLKGLKGADGNYLKDENGGQMTGTVNWLAGYELYDAHFFVTLKPAPMFFVSLAADGGPDWTIQCGFMNFVKTGNLAGIDLGVSGAIDLDEVPQLGDALAAMEPVIESVSAANKSRLLEALRGEARIDVVNAENVENEVARPNLKQVIDEIEDAESIGLRDLLNNR